MRTRILLPLIAGSLSWVSVACGTDPAGNGDVLPDAGNAQPDAGQHPADAGDPDAGEAGFDPETWTWVDVPESACGNGAPTGFGVNPTERSTDLFLYLQGGGACWDAQTCFTVRSAINIETGYGKAQFETEQLTRFGLDRGAPTNPLRDMSWAFVPYCTGDVHSGDAVATYGTRQVHHKGARNMQAFLDRLGAALPNTTRVFLSGSSAGGFGAQINYERVLEAFPSAEVHLLADSAQMINPGGTLLETWLSTWNSAPPTDCPDCLSDFTKLPAYLADTYPDRRFGLLAFDRDQTLTFFFFGFPAKPELFQAATLSLLSSVYDVRSNAKYFLKAGEQHTMLGSLGTLTSSTGVPLNDFVTAWVNGDPTWESVSEVAP